MKRLWNRDNLLFFLLHGAFWGSWSMFYGFLILYLKEQGYSTFFCGLTSTLLGILSILMQPLAGFLTDTFLSIKKYLRLCFLIAIPLNLFIPMSVHILPLAIASILVISLFDYSANSLIDSWLVASLAKNPNLNYGVARAGGPLLSSVSTAVAGFLIAKMGFSYIFLAHGILLLAMVLLCIPLPDVPCGNQKKNTQEKSLSMGKALGTLLAIPAYSSFILSVGFLQFGYRILDAYLTYLVTGAGGSSGSLGLAMSMGGLTEALMMIFLSWFLTKHPIPLEKLYLISPIFSFFLFLGYGFHLTLGMVFFLQAFRAMGFAFYATSYSRLIHEITPKEISATAITLGMSITNGGFGALGVFLGSLLIDPLGLQNFMFLCAGISILTIITGFRSQRLIRASHS